MLGWEYVLYESHRDLLDNIGVGAVETILLDEVVGAKDLYGRAGYGTVSLGAVEQEGLAAGPKNL
jgi:hypothetical protein